MIFRILTQESSFDWLHLPNRSTHIGMYLFFSGMSMIHESCLAFWEMWKRMRCLGVLHYHRFLFLWEIYKFLAFLKKYIWYCYYWCSERMERVLRRMDITCLRDLLLECQPAYTPIWNKLFIILKKALSIFPLKCCASYHSDPLTFTTLLNILLLNQKLSEILNVKVLLS